MFSPNPTYVFSNDKHEDSDADAADTIRADRQLKVDCR